jgi:transcription-repair coupling factor (superfamily II helicase)
VTQVRRPRQLIHTEPPIPAKGQRLSWSNLSGCADALAVSELADQHDGLIVVVTHDSASADRWHEAVEFFRADSESPPWECLQFPDWETLPYDAFSPHQDIISERLATLSSLKATQRGVLTVPVATLLQKIAPPSYLAGAYFDLKRADRFDQEERRLALEAAGYHASDTVTERGQFAVRGSLMDVFPMGAEYPIRIDLFDDEIDTLRTFDPETQRTIEQVDEIRLLPGKEFPFDEAAIARFRDRWHNAFNVDVRRCSVYQDVSSYIAPNGIEYYLPFFFEELGTLFDYLPANVLFIVSGDAIDAATHYVAEVTDRYESLRHDVERPILPPGELYLAVDDLRREFNTARQITLTEEPEKHDHSFEATSLPDIHANARLATPTANLLKFLGELEAPVLFTAESAGRREVFDELLRKAGITTQIVDGFDEYLGHDHHCITVAPLDEGTRLPGSVIVTEADVLGTRQADPRRDTQNKIIDPEQIVRNLTELSLGAPVVHVEHGVGRYLGLQSLTIDGAVNEFLTLAYADGAKLYVPVTSLNLISRYAGADEEHAPLHRLGSDQWEKAKKRAAEKVIDVAAELLDIYARREMRTSASLAASATDYDKFASEFPFEVTLDQQAAIHDTLADLAAVRAMDRLICGDVGFGKTEVAMRAAFAAVQSGRQVAVLVPTTLLAQQHFDTFRDRFATWPVRVEAVSRMRSQSEIDEVAGATRSGKVDILIGTHKLLGESFGFKKLGLVIIDEEHRFGVRQKERLRALRAEVDVLTMTATPIPRTLNMSLSGIRDLSIIATPPAKRLSIKTFVRERRRQQVREAIARELMRGGQVFYLHNEVRTIDAAADELTELLPEARVGVGHGQMPKRQLEQVMSDFYHRRLNVLVCTTIIETGIDIPNANTIIIERADKFGLAQLHQLRGRVGRSHRQAYAYLLTPHPKAMTADAVKRLEAIEAAGELGVGFTLATHDMEIRGAGELLGEDQSGQIESVGFSLYMELLNRAVAAIRDGKVPNMDSPLEPVSQEVNLHAATLIPDDYLPDVHARLILYKRIASAASQDDLDELQVEIIDRFGLLPDPLKRLFMVTGLKLASEALGIVKIELGAERGKLEFSNATSVDPIAIVTLVQQESNTYKLEGASILRVQRQLDAFEDRLAFAYELIQRLTPRETAAA